MEIGPILPRHRHRVKPPAGFSASASLAEAGGDDGAARLSRPSCQDVLADFADESGYSLGARLLARGSSPAEAFEALRFVDSRTASQCSTGSRLAFTQIGSPVIRVCGRQVSDRDLEATTISVTHELLHALGLGENPPTSQAFTAQVALRCGGRTRT